MKDQLSDKIMVLNEVLNLPDFNVSYVKEYMGKLIENHSLKSILVDFDKHDEVQMETLRKKKKKCIREQDFLKAAELRDLERECRKYIEIRVENAVTRSHFFVEGKYLMYIYLGTAKNDEMMSAIFLNTIK